MLERIVIKRKVDSPDWERLRDAARRSMPVDMILHASEGASGRFNVASAGPTLTPDGVESKFILQRIDESIVRR